MDEYIREKGERQRAQNSNWYVEEQESGSEHSRWESWRELHIFDHGKATFKAVK